MFLTETGLAKVFQRVRSFVASQLNSKASVIHTHTSSDVTDLYNLIYPIGSIYLSVNSVDPSTLFGGTWEKIKDKFLLSDGDTYSIGSTGGEATHTLTIDEMPSHDHSAISSSNGDHNHSLVSITGTDDLNFINGTNEFLIQNSDTTMGWPQSVNTSLKYGSTGNAGSHSHSLTVNSTGGSQPHNNMPPYLTINVWKRVA